jgi:serine/threonine protein kinase
MPPPDSSLYQHSLGLPIGYRLEEYRILETLGQGGFGITYLAEDTRMRIKVALTLPSPFSLATPTPTPVTAPSPKPGPNDWLRRLFSPSPTPANELPKK